MILTDTGPLVAMINRNDPNHRKVLDAAKRLPPSPMITTWPCFTEGMYLAFRAGGFPAQTTLWNLHLSGKLLLHHPGTTEVKRMSALMAQYHDAPMDLADASLIACAEYVATKELFTLDSHFRIYRLVDGTFLNVIP